MSKTSIKPTPDNPSPKPANLLAPDMAEVGGPVAPELTEQDHVRFRWSLLVWLLGFAFVWAILIFELANVLFGIIRRAF